MDLQQFKNIHFIGIGGIGISALARMFLLAGKTVSGSDRNLNEPASELSKHGAKIFIGHQADNLPGACDLVIYTIAVGEDNPERQEARRRGLPLFSYPEALGWLSANKRTIAISGTHGKTTTTAMVAEIALAAGLDPTVIVGSFLLRGNSAQEKTNFIAGRGEWLIVEACEYRRSFLNLSPEILLITNIDQDHLDYYRDLADIQQAFGELVAKVPPNGVLICDCQDPHLSAVIAQARCQVIDYRHSDKTQLKLRLPGEHNRLNAQGALAVASWLKVTDDLSQSALNNFRGTWRRFEYLGNYRQACPVIDDYAHHPAEIRATINSAREFIKREKLSGKLTVVFQPHLFSRTKSFLPEFAQALSLADEIIVTDIYPARELPDPSISSAMVVERVKSLIQAPQEAIYLGDKEQVKSCLAERDEPAMIVVMGAGDIRQVAEKLLD